MKIKTPFILTLLLAAGALTHAAGQTNSTSNSSPDVLTVAVFDFESKNPNVSGLGPNVATLLNARLSAEPNLILVERAELDKALGEQELGLSGTVSADSAAKVGQLTGAKILVTGRVFKTDTELFVVAKIIGTETSRVYGEMVQAGVDASISDLSKSLATKIAADVMSKGDTLLAKVETHEDRIAKLKKELGDKKLPVVSVKITEQYFTQHIIDPAAQTEMSLILQQCGFTLADDNSTNRPTIEITGEAFGELGLRKGNLQSCRARIEIKARDVATGRIIAVDRQTSVAVDIAELIAAKSALQNGAGELAERLIPKLVQ
jgi:Curli production assembly/transport component CsgG